MSIQLHLLCELQASSFKPWSFFFQTQGGVFKCPLAPLWPVATSTSCQLIAYLIVRVHPFPPSFSDRGITGQLKFAGTPANHLVQPFPCKQDHLEPDATERELVGMSTKVDSTSVGKLCQCSIRKEYIPLALQYLHSSLREEQTEAEVLAPLLESCLAEVTG